MTGWQMLAIQGAIFIVAAGGILFFSLLALRAAGPALNRGRRPASRALFGFAVLACIGGILASAAAGFLAIAYLLYIATQP